MAIDPGLSAALGALVIAVLNEWRARVRARTAQIEREESNARLLKAVNSTEGRSESDGAASPP